MGIRDSYLDLADSAAGLLADPAVAAGWNEPSALRYYQVSGLAGHLAGQIFFIDRVLAAPVPAEPPIPLLEYYGRVEWLTADQDDPVHVRIRTGSVQSAADGPAALADRARATVARLRDTLPAAPEDRTVRLPTWGPYSLRLDDFVTSRLLELVVHVDDLAVSAGVATPALPAPATETVIDLLSRLAVRRHGTTAVIRALARAERAPATIAAF
jgi:hypothetical protein